MKLFNKATAVLALVTLVSGIFSTGVSAYSPAQLEAANALAAKGIIVTKADAAGYNLDQNVLRQEIAAVARGVAGLEKATVCNNVFSDVSAKVPNTWACYSIEALYNANLIASNSTFRPEANISKAEAVGMMVKAAYDGEYVYNSKLSTSWQEQVVAFAVEKGIISPFTNYDTAATRGFVFEVGTSAMSAGSSEDDLLGDLLGNLLGDTTSTGTGTNTSTGANTVVSGDNILNVTLSPDTPAGATIPGAISGLPVAKFDFTAGSEDVTISSLTVKRTGLSDKDTLANIAVFSDEGRVSKGKDDSQENYTQAELTLNTGGVVVMAGETKTLTVVVDIAGAAKATGDEFAIELIKVVASSTVDGVSHLVANTMKVGWVDAATLKIQDDTNPSAVKVGQDDAEIAKFKIDGDTNRDVLLKSITLKWNGSVDEESELANYSLLNNGKVVATTAFANGKYVTFNLGDGITIAEDKTEKFSVTADIIGGAAKTMEFVIDKSLDITALDTQYGYGAGVNLDSITTFGIINIDAGELTLTDIDAPHDKIRQDMKNVILGSIQVNNIAGKNLELQKFGFKALSTIANVGAIIENVEMVVNEGTSYELSLASLTSMNTYAEDTDLGISLPQGITTIQIRADTLKTVPLAATLTLSMATLATTGADWVFYVVETEDDTIVSDLSPSSLAFNKIEVIDSSATVAKVPLAAATVVKGTKEIVGMQFEVEAGEASSIDLSEIKAKIMDKVGGASAPATNSEISAISLYKGSVSASNLLKQVSGSKLSSGIATFDWFRLTIASNVKQTFIITFSLVDGIDTVAGTPYTVSLVDITAEDDESNDLVVKNAGIDIASNNLSSGKLVSVTDQGILAITEDANNADNKNPKTILAGESATVFSADVLATKEAIDVDKITFTVNNDLTSSVESASLYLSGTLVATNTNSDIVAWTSAVAQVNTYTPVVVNVAAAQTDTITINGTAIAFTSDATPTVAEITLGLTSAINASAQAALVTAVDGTTKIVVTSDVAGTAFTSAVSANITNANTTANAAATGNTITFKNLSKLIVPTTASELILKLKTFNIGSEKIGKTVTWAKVTQIKVVAADAKGFSSGMAIAGDITTTIANGATIAIVPTVITPTITSSLTTGSAELKLTINSGNNTVDNDSSKISVLLTNFVFSELSINSTGYTIYKDGESARKGTISSAWVFAKGTMSDADLTISGNTTYIIVPGGTKDMTYNLNLTKNWVVYSANGVAGSTWLTTNMTEELKLGSKTY